VSAGIGSTNAADWQGLLDHDEGILWQGRPSGTIRLEFRSPFEPIFFTFFTGFSIFWMHGASKAPGHFWMFGLLFFAVGCYNLIGVHFWRAFARSQSHYTLTSKRALIATNILGRRKLTSYPITPGTTLEFVDGKLGSVFFAKEELRGRNGTTTVPIGFELIEDARAVSALFRKMQGMQE
jgi:hypothetical protein